MTFEVAEVSIADLGWSSANSLGTHEDHSEVIVQLVHDLKVFFPINTAGAKQNRHAGDMRAQQQVIGYHRILNIPLIGSAKAGRTVPRKYLQ